MFSRSFWLGGAIAALLLLAIYSWNWLQERPAAPSPELLALGKGVYQGNCAVCHGARLEGQMDWRVRKPDGRLPAPPHDETGHTWHHSDQQLFEITKRGLAPFAPAGYESDMPAFGDILSNEEIRALLAFIKSTWPEDIQERQKQISEGAKR